MQVTKVTCIWKPLAAIIPPGFYSPVAQWQSNRLLTDRLLVRVQPGEPFRKIIMPHCLIEYSNGLENQLGPEKLMKTVYAATLESGLFDEKDIKVRMVLFSDFLSSPMVGVVLSDG